MIALTRFRTTRAAFVEHHYWPSHKETFTKLDRGFSSLEDWRKVTEQTWPRHSCNVLASQGLREIMKNFRLIGIMVEIRVRIQLEILPVQSACSVYGDFVLTLDCVLLSDCVMGDYEEWTVCFVGERDRGLYQGTMSTFAGKDRLIPHVIYQDVCEIWTAYRQNASCIGCKFPECFVIDVRKEASTSVTVVF